MILTYHEVTPDPSRYVYSVTTRQFAEHLSATADWIRESTEPVLTFDDGHASHIRHAAPALDCFGLKASFFITAGWTGQKAGYMNAAQLRELAALGHHVQSHGWSHALLTQCSRSDLIEELRRSKTWLEDSLGESVDAISLPGGRWNRGVLEQCAEEGYRRVFTSDPDPAVRTLYGLEICGRAMVRNKHTGRDVLRLLQARPGMWSATRVAFIAKRSARALVGDSAYQSLWARVGSSREKTAIHSEYEEPGA